MFCLLACGVLMRLKGGFLPGSLRAVPVRHRVDALPTLRRTLMGCLAVAADRSLTPRILPLSCSDVKRLRLNNPVSPPDSLCYCCSKAAQYRAFVVTLFVSPL